MTTVTLGSGDLLLRGIPQDVQERAAAAAGRAGLTLADIARIAITRLANGGSLPFDPLDEYADEIPNEETLQAIREAEEHMDDLPSYGSFDEMLAAAMQEGAAQAA